MGLDAVELARVAHACEDYAGCWYGRQPSGLVFSRTDCARYVSEGYLGDLHDSHKGGHTLAEVWDAVAAYLDGHPGILAAGRLSDGQRAERQAARDAKAKALLGEAHAAFTAGRCVEALDLVDRAEVASPGSARWESYRRSIRRRMAGVGSG